MSRTRASAFSYDGTETIEIEGVSSGGSDNRLTATRTQGYITGSTITATHVGAPAMRLSVTERAREAPSLVFLRISLTTFELTYRARTDDDPRFQAMVRRAGLR